MAHSIEGQRLDQPDNASIANEKPSEVKEDESQFPTGMRLAVIIVSILFAMFLVALVWLSWIHRCSRECTNDSFALGSNYHCHRSPPNRQPVQCPRRHQLVCQCLSLDKLCHPALLGQSVHLLLDQDRLLSRDPGLRNRIGALRRCPQLQCLHCGTCDSRYWFSRYLLWRDGDHRTDRAAS